MRPWVLALISASLGFAQRSWSVAGIITVGYCVRVVPAILRFPTSSILDRWGAVTSSRTAKTRVRGVLWDGQLSPRSTPADQDGEVDRSLSRHPTTTLPSAVRFPQLTVDGCKEHPTPHFVAPLTDFSIPSLASTSFRDAFVPGVGKPSQRQRAATTRWLLDETIVLPIDEPPWREPSKPPPPFRRERLRALYPAKTDRYLSTITANHLRGVAVSSGTREGAAISGEVDTPYRTQHETSTEETAKGLVEG